MTIEIAGATDVDSVLSADFVGRFGGVAYPSLDDVLGDPDVDAIVNLTFPAVHADVTTAALNAGKHVHSEKPLAGSYADARSLVDLAVERGLRLSCSPITFLGEAQQTAWRLVESGAIGRVRALQAYKVPVERARAGHSTAMNLSDVDYREVHRGMVAATPGYFRAATMVEARVRALPRLEAPIEHQMAIRFHVGTAEVAGRIYLLDRKQVLPGEEAYAQFRLAEPVVVPWREEYGGCTSWVDLAGLPADPALVPSEPALSDGAFEARYGFAANDLPAGFEKPALQT